MKKGKRSILIIFALLIAAAFFYTRPLTLEQLYSDVDWSAIEQIQVKAEETVDGARPTVGNGQTAYGEFNTRIPIEDEAAQELMVLVKEAKFRRSLINLIPRGHTVSYYSSQPGEFQWWLFSAAQIIASQ